MPRENPQTRSQTRKVAAQGSSEYSESEEFDQEVLEEKQAFSNEESDLSEEPLGLRRSEISIGTLPFGQRERILRQQDKMSSSSKREEEMKAVAKRVIWLKTSTPSDVSHFLKRCKLHFSGKPPYAL